MKRVESLATISVSSANNCTFMGALEKIVGLTKFVNMSFLIVTLSLHTIALSHFVGVLAGEQAGSAAKCLKLQAIVDELLVPLLKLAEKELSVS